MFLHFMQFYYVSNCLNFISKIAELHFAKYKTYKRA